MPRQRRPRPQMRKQATAPEKSGAVCFAELGVPKNFSESVPRGPVFTDRKYECIERWEVSASRISADAPHLERSSNPEPGRVACREADWVELGNVAYLTAHSSARLLKLSMPSDRDTRRGGGV